MSNISNNIAAIAFDRAWVRYPLCITYITFGAPALLINITVFIVLSSDRKLLLKSATIAGLAGGNLFNGIHAFGYGVYRLPLLRQKTIDLPESTWTCMASMLPTCILLGFSIPAAMQFVIGLERLLAIAAFKWYRVNWSPKKSWQAVGIVYALVLGFLVFPAWYVIFSTYRLVTKECSNSAIMDQTIMTCLYRFISLFGTSGVACVLAAALIGRSHLKTLNLETANMNHLKRQLRITRMLLIIVLFDFCFVIIPNVLNDRLISQYTSAISSFFPYATAAAYCCNSMINILVYFSMNTEFRKAVLATVRKILPKCCFVEVAPISQTATAPVVQPQ